LKPDDALNYRNRGLSYDKLDNHSQAIENFKIAAKLGDKKVQDYLKSQGIDWEPESLPSTSRPDKSYQQPVKKVESSVDADPTYRGIKGIVLMNGDKIEGQVISITDETVKIRTKDGKVSSYSFMKEVRRFISE
jgi:hypothetical protein